MEVENNASDTWADNLALSDCDPRTNIMTSSRFWTTFRKATCRGTFAAVLLTGLGVFVALDMPRLHADEPAASLSKHEHWVTGLVFTPDSSRLVTVGGGSLRYRPGDVLVWDVVSGKRVASLSGHGSHVWAVAMQKKAARGATSDYSGRIIVWDFVTGKAVKQLDHFQAWVACLAYGPDDRQLAAGGQDGTVAVWETNAYDKPRVIKVGDSPVSALAFLPDGKLLVASLDKTLKLVDPASGKVVSTWKDTGDVIWTIAVAPGNKYVATGGVDRSIRIYRPDGTHVASVPGHRDWVRSLQFSPDGKELASASHDQRVRLWNVDRVAAEGAALAASSQKVVSLVKARDAAVEALDTAEKTANAAQDKQKVAEKIAAWKEAVAKQQQAAEALKKDPKKAELKKAADAAKSAAGKLAGEIDAKIKSLQGDKKLSETLTALKKKGLEEVQKQAEAWKKEAESAENARVAAQRKLDDAEAALKKAKEALKAQVDALAVDLPVFESSVWAVAYSPDGKWLATGTHRIGKEFPTDTVRIWRRSDRKSMFTLKKAKAE